MVQVKTLDDILAQTGGGDSLDTVGNLDDLIAKTDKDLSQTSSNSGWFQNYLAGFNGTIASVLDLPTKAVAGLIEGATGIKLPERPSTEEEFAQFGVKTKPVEEGLASKIGAETAKGILTTAGLTVGAGVLAARQAPGAIKAVLDAIAKHPFLNIFTELGATPGAVLGQQVGAGASSGAGTGIVTGAAGGAALGRRVAGPVGTVAGGVLGGIGGGIGGSFLPGEVDETGATLGGALVGGLGAGGVAATGRAAARGVEGVVNRFRSGAPTTPTEPIVNPAASPERSTAWAEHQIAGDVAMVDDMIEDVINTIPRTQTGTRRGVPTFATPESASVAVANKLDEAEKVGRQIEGRYWARVPSKTPVPGEDALAALDNAEADMRVRNSEAHVPEAAFKRIRDLWGGDDIDDPTVKSLPVPTVRKIIGERGALLDEIRAEAAAAAPRAQVISNLVRLRDILGDAIKDALPNDVTVQQATRVSKLFHDLFDRGPVADALRMKRRGDTTVDPRQIVDQLLSTEYGLDAGMNVVKRLRAIKPVPGRPGAPRPHAYPQEATPDEMLKLKELETSFEDAIRTQFRTTAEAEGPEAAAKYMRDVEPMIKPLAKMSADFQQTRTQLEALMDHRTFTETSALAKYAQKDTQKAIQSVYAHPNPAQNARELMRSFGGDPVASEAFRDGVVQELFNRARVSPDGNTLDPMKLKRQLADPKTKRLLQEVLPQDQMNRLERVTEVAYRISQGDIQPTKERILGATLIPGRIAGAIFGRLIGNLFGASTIQTPGITSNWVKKLVIRAINENDPTKLLANAVRDPTWERFLMGKEPVTSKELAASMAMARRLVSVEEGLRQDLQERYKAWLGKSDVKMEAQRFDSYVSGNNEGRGYINEGVNMGGDPYGNWAQDQGPRGAFLHLQAQSGRPEGMRAMLENAPFSANVEDRRLTDKTIQGYRGILEAGDAEGLSQVPFARAMARRRGAFGGVGGDEGVPLPRRRPR